MGKQTISIPLMHPYMEPPAFDLPITPGENLKLAMEHKKPKWMPIYQYATQWVFPPAFREGPPMEPKDGYDWFGTFYKYSAVQGSPTPVGDMFSEIGEWREKVKWPDLTQVDWAEGFSSFERDPERLTACRLMNGCFERLHGFEGFEQALCDILLEPEECKAFFDRLNEHRLECIRKIQEVWHFDYMVNNDDWSHKLAPFFSHETFEETLLESAIATAQAVHDSGAFYMVHCCGLMESWLPYLVNEIHVDALEIQTINNFHDLLNKYGDRVTAMYTPEPNIMYDPETTPEQARALARQIVDDYGAQTCDGPGVIIRPCGNIPETYYAFVDEIYQYSGDKYASL